MTASTEALKILQIAAQAASDKMAENLVALDVTNPMPLTDIFLIASGRNERQVMAISDAIEEIRREYANYSSPQDAVKAMYESGLWDGGDLPSCEEYTFHFLWCLHAIKWFCQRLNEIQPDHKVA